VSERALILANENDADIFNPFQLVPGASLAVKASNSWRLKAHFREGQHAVHSFASFMQDQSQILDHTITTTTTTLQSTIPLR
jgi:hypothetical protein